MHVAADERQSPELVNEDAPTSAVLVFRRGVLDGSVAQDVAVHEGSLATLDEDPSTHDAITEATEAGDSTRDYQPDECDPGPPKVKDSPLLLGVKLDRAGLCSLNRQRPIDAVPRCEGMVT